MNLKFYVLIFIFIFQCTLGLAADDEAVYKSLCTYDNFCSRLKNRDGTWIPVKSGILAVMHELRSPLQQISSQLGVDANAVAGAILAENSMNVQVDSDVHSFLEVLKRNPLANDISRLIRGKSFSLGLGQIKPESAFAAEDLLASSEKRTPRSEDEVKTALLNPIESLKYMPLRSQKNAKLNIKKMVLTSAEILQS